MRGPRPVASNHWVATHSTASSAMGATIMKLLSTLPGALKVGLGWNRQ